MIETLMKEHADQIDQLVTTDFNQQEVIDDLFVGAYDHHGSSPCLLAAERLAGAVDPGDTVVIVTGFVLPPTDVQETDGPVGAASLAHAISAGLDAHPIILSEAEAVPSVKAAARGLGLNVLDGIQPTSTSWACSVDSFPVDPEEASRRAAHIIDEHDPSALVAVEKGGENDVGVYHTATGVDVTGSTAKMEELFKQSDALSIGIGDIGNELGMATIGETIREHVPYANDCGCGCGEGVTAGFAADVVVPATVSNWGAHGIAAGLSRIEDEPLLHEPELERRALLACAEEGAIDATGRADGWCDFLSPETHMGIVRLLKEVEQVDLVYE